MSAAREFLAGAGFLVRGFAFWGSNPRLAALGAVPPLLVGAVMLGLMATLVLASLDIAAWATPFADAWSRWPRLLVRLTAAGLLVVGAGVLCVLTFSALSLAAGAVVYERIAVAVDARLGMRAPRVELAFWRGLRRGVSDALQLLLIALPLALVVFAVGLLPLIGSLVGFCLGAVVGGRALAIELTGTAMDARGRSVAERRRLLAEHRARTMGFGVACYLLFLIPLVAVAAMPAATAGGTLLARSLFGERLS